MNSYRRPRVNAAGGLGLAAALVTGASFAIAAAAESAVARFGGAAWVAILTWIILMPVLAPWLKRRESA